VILLCRMVNKKSTKVKKNQNLNRYAGEWVVFVDDAIVAHDKVLTEAMGAVKKRGLQNKASVFLVPRKDEGPYVL